MIGKADPEIISHLQQLARNDESIKEMLNYLIETLKLTTSSRLIVMFYFKEAFSLTIHETYPLAAWNFFEDGTCDIEMIEEEIKPLIYKAYVHWYYP